MSKKKQRSKRFRDIEKRKKKALRRLKKGKNTEKEIAIIKHLNKTKESISNG